MTPQQQTKELRHFGLIVGGVFAAIGLWPMVWHGTGPRLWALGLGGTLAGLGAIMPSVLAPIHRGWMFLGHIMGWINTRILLGLFFYGVVTPMGVVAWLAGNDFMRMKPAPHADSYRVVRTPRPTTHFRNQF